MSRLALLLLRHNGSLRIQGFESHHIGSSLGVSYQGTDERSVAKPCNPGCAPSPSLFVLLGKRAFDFGGKMCHTKLGSLEPIFAFSI